MKILRLLTVAAALALTGAPAVAATIVTYSSSTGSLAPSYVGTDIYATDIMRGAALNEARSDSLASRDWSQATSMDDAIKAGSYLTWGFKSVVPLALESFGIAFQRSPQGPQSIALQMAVNGGPWSLLFDFHAPDFTHNSAWIASAAFPELLDVTNAMFRFVGWNAGNQAGTLLLPDSKVLDGHAFTLTGSTMVAIPVPPALPLLGGGLLLLGLLAHRRRKAAA